MGDLEERVTEPAPEAKGGPLLWTLANEWNKSLQHIATYRVRRDHWGHHGPNAGYGLTGIFITNWAGLFFLNSILLFSNKFFNGSPFPSKHWEMAMSPLFICKVLLTISVSYHAEYSWSSTLNHGACKYCYKKTNLWTTVSTRFPGARRVERPSHQSRGNVTRVIDTFASGALEFFICDWSVCPLPLLPSKRTEDAEKKVTLLPSEAIVWAYDKGEEGATKFEVWHPQPARASVLEKNDAL